VKLFATGDFSGGLNALTESAKLSNGQYALLVNGRTRRNVVDPTYKHLRITLPQAGNIQGLFGQGSTLFVAIDGVMYYAEVEIGKTINLRQIPNWTPMSATAAELFMEAVPATTNLLKREAANPQSVSTTFTDSIGRFPECLVVQDGINIPRAIFPNNGWVSLGSYSAWTFDQPIYVPIGLQMAYSGGKLYTVSPDGKLVYQSVSGRPTDFVIAIDNNGNKLGDVGVTSIGVSYAEITSLQAAEDGNVLAATLYGTWLLVPDKTNLYWGEPYTVPVEQFPVGALNQNSYADIVGDTAFLTQSGVQSFNVTKQAKIASNNFPLGAPISSLLAGTQLAQAAACNFNDYAYFGVNTVYGPMTAVYDTMTGHYTALDNSFGTAKFFAKLLTNNQQQLVFATDDNQLYLANGDTTEVNVTSVYLGDYVAYETQQAPVGKAGKFLDISGVKLSFVDVLSSGEINIKIYIDKKEVYSETRPVTATEVQTASVEQLPFDSRDSTIPLSFQLPKIQSGWKVGIFVSWSFNGSLSEATIEGNATERDSPMLQGTTSETVQDVLAAIGNITFEDNLVTSDSVNMAGKRLELTKGEWYLFDPKASNVSILDGQTNKNKMAIFKSSGICALFGQTGSDCALRNIQKIKLLVDQMAADKITSLIGLGNYGVSTDDLKEFLYILGLQNISFLPVMGDNETAINDGLTFKALTSMNYPRLESFNNCVWCLYENYSNPMGFLPGSNQDKYTTQQLLNTDKRFKFFAVHNSPYTNDSYFSGGDIHTRLDYPAKDVDAVFAASGNCAEFIRKGTIDYFNGGLGGAEGDPFDTPPIDGTVWEINTGVAYFLITVDAITARIELKSNTGETLQTRTIYG
jgi:hypothetical protein